MRLAEDAGGGGGSVAGVAGLEHLARDIEVTKACATCGQAFTCLPHGACWCLALEYRPRRGQRLKVADACVCPACRGGGDDGGGPRS